MIPEPPWRNGEIDACTRDADRPGVVFLDVGLRANTVHQCRWGQREGIQRRNPARRSDAVSITVPNDVSYRRSMTYRAVPLLALLLAPHASQFDTLEAHATDGFVCANSPGAGYSWGNGGAIAYLAVEDRRIRGRRCRMRKSPRVLSTWSGSSATLGRARRAVAVCFDESQSCGESCASLAAVGEPFC